MKEGGRAADKSADAGRSENGRSSRGGGIQKGRDQERKAPTGWGRDQQREKERQLGKIRK